MLMNDDELAEARRDFFAGGFRERIIVWPFVQMGGTKPNDVQTIDQTIVSCGGDWVRVMAMQGALAGAVSDFAADLELAFLRLRLQCNGQDMMSNGRGDNTCSF